LADRASGRHYPAVASPDSALDQATAWAIGRVGGQLRVDPAAEAPGGWEGEDVAGVLEDARTWARVRGNDVIEPHDFLRRVVGLLLGARLDGVGGRLELRPSLPDGWKSLGVRRLRAHRTLLDLEIKRRAEWITVRIAVMFGPPVAVAVGWAGDQPVSRVLVDEVALEGTRAIFTAAGEHEVTLYLGLRP